MARREELQVILETITGHNVYFQPPASMALKYPCIIYKYDNAESSYADNHAYLLVRRYQIMHISRNIEDLVLEKLGRLPHSRLARHYIADNLYHDVYNLYF